MSQNNLRDEPPNDMVSIWHDLLDSKIATATALYNEWLKWCEANDLRAETIAGIPKLFEVSQAQYNRRREDTTHE